MPSSIRNGRSAAVPGSKTVSMWPISRARGPPARPSNVATTVAPRRPAGSGRISTLGAELGRGTSADPAPDLVDAGRRVAPAVDVDEPCEIGQVGRQVGADGGPQGVELGGRRESAASSVVAVMVAQSSPRAPCYPARTVRLVETRLLEGPNVYRLEPVVKLEVAIGRRRTWYGQRDPGRHALVHLGAAVPARDWPDGGRRDRRPGSGACAPTTARAAAGCAVHRSSDPGPLDRHLPVGRGGARADPDRGGARPRRARRVAVADRPPDRRPGTAAGALDRADRRGPGHAADVGPRRRPPRSRSCRSRGPTARAP